MELYTLRNPVPIGHRGVQKGEIRQVCSHVILQGQFRECFGLICLEHVREIACDSEGITYGIAVVVIVQVAIELVRSKTNVVEIINERIKVFSNSQRKLLIKLISWIQYFVLIS